MSSLVDTRRERSPVFRGVLDPSQRWGAEPLYGVVLMDRWGCILGASTVSGLPGEVAMPLGVNLRTHDLRRYLEEDRGFHRPRRFPLASAAWVQVKGKRMRVGIYIESGEARGDAEDLEPDLGSIAAILSGQVV